MRLALILTVVLAGCKAGKEDPPSVTTTALGKAPCPVTVGDAGARPPEGIDPASRPVAWATADSYWYGNEALWVRLPPASTLKLASGGVKFPWWRVKTGALSVQARPEAGGEMIAAHVPEGYGESGFQVSGLHFSGPGCWRIKGWLGADTLEFVLRVEG